VKKKKPRPLRLDHPRLIIDLLIHSFEQSFPPPPPRGTTRTVEEIALLTTARELFLCGGAAALERLGSRKRWLQVGVRFRDDEQHHAFLDAALADAVQAWREEGLISDFFFMNKAPGVRLRFCGLRPDESLQRRVFALLDARRRGGRLVDYELGVYDGETYQFGGEAGLELFHRFSTIDSLSILRLHELARTGRMKASLPKISLLLMNHLIRQLSSGDWELWDVWCNMRLAKRTLSLSDAEHRAALESLEHEREVLNEIVFQPERAIAALSEPERRLVKDYQAQVVAWTDDALATVRSGALLYGMRKILPFYVIFHWNRLGVHLLTQCSLTFYLQALLDPKKDDQPKVERGGAKEGKRSGARPKLRS
jgi:thiopeptide-type bacteriocin biosynthesis protein